MRYAMLVALVIGLAALMALVAPRSSSQEKLEYLCPPCGATCDAVVHAAAGNCEACGMKLMTRAEIAAAEASRPARKRAAILVFPGVQIIDFTGPYEVLGQARFEVYTVARSKESLQTAMGLSVTPEYDFTDAPLPDVLVVPGGDVHGAEDDAETVTWVRETSGAAQYTMSVCNGAFILAKAGLLDGEMATTFYGLIDDLREAAPKTTVVNDRRYVDNGRVMTTAGLSSGIDGTLALIEKFYGHGRAQEIALHLEYDWRPEAGFARAALADMHVPRLDVDGVSDIHTLSTSGTREHWKKEWAFSSELGLEEIKSRVESELASKGWSRVSGKSGQRAAQASSSWSFSDDSGRPWHSSVTIAPLDGDHGEYRMTMTLERAG